MRSFWAQLALALMAISLLASAALGWLSYRVSRRMLREEAVRSVGVLAANREQALARLVDGQHQRAMTLLRSAATSCARRRQPSDQRDCYEDVMRNFVLTESAEAARLDLPGGDVIVAGKSAAAANALRDAAFDELTPPPPQLARFRIAPDGAPRYYVSARVEAMALTVRFPFDDVDRIFADRTGLGQTGESLLVDEQARFLTPPRRPGAAQAPLSPALRSCLAGRRSDSIGPDYTGQSTVHAYQPALDVGAGCAIVNVSQAEAFAPLGALQRRAALLGLLFALLSVPMALALASRISRPLEQLTREARALRAGDFDGPMRVPEHAPAEVRDFARTFAELTRSIVASRAALEANEKRIRAVLDNALDAVVAIDHRGVIIDWNPRAEAMFGWSRDEALGRALAETIIPPRYRAAHLRGLEHFLATGEGPLLGKRIEIAAIRRDGSELSVQLAITVIASEAGVTFSAFISDITEQRQAEAEVERQRARLRTLFLYAPSLMALTCGPDHLVEVANPQVADFFGGRKVIGRRLGELIEEVTGSGDMANLDHVYRTGEPFYAKEAQLKVRANGTVRSRYLDVICQPLLGPDGLPEGVMVHAVDVTAQVEARRRVEEAVRLRDDFLSIASHELKTPLTSLGLQMQSVARVARHGGLERLAPSRLSQLVDVSNRQIRRLTQLVDDLIDAGRVSDGPLMLHKEDVELVQLAREVIARHADEAERAQCRIELTGDAEVHGRFDRTRIEQVLSNLLTNSFKYGAGQPVTVRVESRPHAALLSVSDRGIGIPPDAQRLIFERWGRAVSPRNFGGLGLGLYIVRQILEVHGGRITVTSAPGEGATFTCELPRDD